MTAPSFCVVPEHVSRNPVARAIQRVQVRNAVANFSTRLHLLTEGEQCPADIDATGKTLAVAQTVLEARGMPDDTLASGIDALIDMAQQGYRWQTRYAGALDAALQQAQDVFAQASATETRAAWLRVCR